MKSFVLHLVKEWWKAKWVGEDNIVQVKIIVTLEWMGSRGVVERYDTKRIVFCYLRVVGCW